MLAWHVNTILVILVTNNASVRMSSLTHKCCFNCTNVCLTRTYLEYRFIHYFKEKAHLTLVWKTPPSTIRSAHVFNVELVSDWGYRSVNIWQVLIFWEVQKIGLLSTNCDFLVVWNFDAVPKRRSFNYLQSQRIIFESSLKLITSHFNDHVLN